jgi:hypothetical protein
VLLSRVMNKCNGKLLFKNPCGISTCIKPVFHCPLTHRGWDRTLQRLEGWGLEGGHLETVAAPGVGRRLSAGCWLMQTRPPTLGWGPWVQSWGSCVNCRVGIYNLDEERWGSLENRSQWLLPSAWFLVSFTEFSGSSWFHGSISTSVNQGLLPWFFGYLGIVVLSISVFKKRGSIPIHGRRELICPLKRSLWTP